MRRAQDDDLDTFINESLDRMLDQVLERAPAPLQPTFAWQPGRVAVYVPPSAIVRAAETQPGALLIGIALGIGIGIAIATAA